MIVRVRLFAALREIVGREEIEMEIPSETTAGGLWEMVVSKHPKLNPYTTTIQVAINQEFADRAARLDPQDEVAFLPPVSGG